MHTTKTIHPVSPSHRQYPPPPPRPPARRPPYPCSLTNDAVSEVVVTICCAYGSFCIAEAFSTSGVLAVVACGLYLAAHRSILSPSVAEFVHEFWELLSFLLNTLIFIISGKIIGYSVADPSDLLTYQDLAITVYLYVAIHVSRGVSTLAAQPFVNKNASRVSSFNTGPSSMLGVLLRSLSS